MNISIKWQQTHDENRNLLPKPVWNVFDVSDILNENRNHALDLLKRSINVVIKQDEMIISNSLEMRNLYRKKGHRVYDLASIQPSTDRLHVVGFL